MISPEEEDRLSERNEEIYGLFEKGCPVSRLAQSFSLEKSTVISILRMHGVRRRPSQKCFLCRWCSSFEQFTIGGSTVILGNCLLTGRKVDPDRRKRCFEPPEEK